MSTNSKPQEQPHVQGELVRIKVVRQQPIVEAVEGGMYPEDMSPTGESDERRHFHEVVHEQVVAEQQTRRRRENQLGKHSPLERDGSYCRIQLGDWLPGFGAVRKRNFDEAVSFADDLESKRLATQGTQPSLVNSQPDDVKAAIVETADALDIRRGLIDVLPGKAPQNRELATTKIKLEGLRDDDRAGFIPTTHREKSQGYELLDYMIPGKYEKGVSTRLDQIFNGQQREMREKGLSAYEARDRAVDTIRSVVREWGDYYTDARKSWVKLDAVRKLVSDPNPQLTMDVLLESEELDQVITQVVRYNALKQLRDTDKPLGFDPLWVREDRTQPTDEKHKTVEDMFTYKNEEFMAAYVRRRAQQMTAGQVRSIVLQMMHDQANRGKFWRGNLEALNQDYRQFADLALAQVA